MPVHWTLIFFRMESAVKSYLLGHLLLMRVKACSMNERQDINQSVIDWTDCRIEI